MNLKEVQKIIDSMNEKLASHNGGVELVNYDDEKKVVRIRLIKACSHCPMAQMTTDNFIKKELLEAMPGLKEIEVE